MKHGTKNIHALTLIIAGCTQSWNKSTAGRKRGKLLISSSLQNLWFHLPGEVTTTAREDFALQTIKISLCFAPHATVSALGLNGSHPVVPFTHQ